MSKHRAVRRRFSSVLRTDDRVAPGLARKRAPLIVGGGIVLIIAGVLVSVLAVNTKSEMGLNKAGKAESAAALSQQDVQDVRAYLAERRAVRERESDVIDQRLAEHTAALCAALAEVAKDATRADRVTLDRAGSQLGCDPLPSKVRTPLTTSSPGSSAPVPSTTPSGAQSPSGGAGSAGTPTTAPRPPQSSSGATPTPKPSPVPSRSGLLDPVTDPVCRLLRVCL